MKLREDGIAGGVREKSAPGRNFAKAALFGASLALFGCGDTINNYYYTGPDGGAKSSDSTPNAERGAGDSLIPDACITKAKLPACSDAVVVAGVLNQGESLPISPSAGGSSYRLVLDDGQVLNGKNYAVVSLTDDCGRILMKTKIEEGSAKKFVLGGQVLEVEATEAAFGMTFGAKWANFTLRAPCQDMTQYWCPAVMGVINQGESILVDNLKFRLDDIEAKGSSNAAILSVLDANDNILKKDKIAEGSSVEMILGGKSYLVSVKKAAPGITFGAIWAEIEISGKSENPCGS